jgi:dihydrofolate reductase
MQSDDDIGEFKYIPTRATTSIPHKCIGMIVCIDSEYGIGMHSGVIPFRNSADMKNFKKLTIHSIIVMGRNTYESIGHPLPNRENVIISTTLPSTYNGLRVFKCIDECLEYFKHDKRSIYIIGGAGLYNECMERCIPNRIYVTRVDHNYNCDVHVNSLCNIHKWYTSIVNQEVFNVNQELSKHADSSWSYSEYVKSG